MKNLLLAVTLFCCLSLQAEDRFKNVKIKTIKVSRNVYMLMGAGGNIGLSSGEDGNFIIDDQFAPLHGRVLKAIATVSKKPIKFVINTHWHGDHTGGNEMMAQRGSIIMAQDNVRKRMSIENFSKVFKRKTPPAKKGALPIITFSKEMTVHLNGEEAKIIHVPKAHTDGDALIFFKESNVIHTGDTFFNGFYPYIDVDAGGSLDGMIKAQKKILSLSNAKTKIIPGHGPLANKEDLKRNHQVLIGIRKNMETLIAKGLSIDEVLKKSPTASFDKIYGGGFIKPEVFTRILYRSLKDK